MISITDENGIEYLDFTEYPDEPNVDQTTVFIPTCWAILDGGTDK